MLRFHGSRDKQTFSYVGVNSRLDEMQAAIVRRLLREVTAGTTAAAPPPTATARSGLGDSVMLPGRGRPGDSTSTTCTSSARRSATRSPGG